MVGSGELGPVPDRLVSFARRELARNLDRFPADALAYRQPLIPSLSERSPHGLPAAELADSAGSLRQWEEQAIAQAAPSPMSGVTNAPSAVEQPMTGRSPAAASAASLPLSMSARMLPP